MGGISGFAHESFLVTEQNGLAAQRLLSIAGTNFDGFHWRSCCLRQGSQSVSREIRTFGELDSSGSNLHGESHTGRASAFFESFLQ